MASMKAEKTVSTQSPGQVKKEPAAAAEAAKLSDDAAVKAPASRSGAKKAASKAPQEPKKKMENELSNLDNSLPLKMRSTQKRKMASLKPHKPAGTRSSPAPANIKVPTSPKTCQSCTPGAATGTPTPAPKATPTSKPTSNKAHELGIKGAGAKLSAD